LKEKSSFREIRYREKRKKILENAARIFARKGYEGASLEEIAAKLQLTKASLYHYIKSKEEMLYLIQAQAIEQVQDALDAVINSNMDPVDKLKEAVKSHVKIVTQKHVIGALRQQELILPLKWRTKIIAQRDLYEETFQKIIKQGIETGVFKTRDWKMSIMAALGVLNWIVRWYTPHGKLTVKEIEEAMSDFILKGFGVSLKK
jgi:AcrR family transcriptional regulator